MKQTGRRRMGVGVAAACTASVLAFGSGGVSVANHTANVSNETEYRNALTDLSAGDTAGHTINVTADITLASGDEPIYNGDQDLTINGNGFTIDGGGNSSVIRHLSEDSTLTVNSLVATNAGEGADGGAVVSAGNAVINSSTIVGNAATSRGGGIFMSTNSDLLRIEDSTVTGNTAIFGAGVFALSSSTDITIVNSTVTGNTATSSGGGVSTAGDLILTYATIAGNSAGTGANVELRGPGDLTSFGSVIAGPLGGGANCSFASGATTASSSHNHDDDGSCGFTGTGDTSDGPDPKLGPLSSNGGPTQTRMPQSGSPLIDAIPVADCDLTVLDDQRGESRPADGDADGVLACDIGAVELQRGEVPPPGDGADPAEPVEGDPSFTG